jgi:hypothetical protein
MTNAPLITATLYIDGVEHEMTASTDRVLFEESLIEAAARWEALDGFKVCVERVDGIHRAIRS